MTPSAINKNSQPIKANMSRDPPMSLHTRIYWQHMADHVPSGLGKLVASSMDELKEILSNNGVSGELFKVKEVPSNITLKGYAVYGLNIEGRIKDPFVYECHTCHKFLLESPRILDYDDGRGKGYDMLCIKCNNVMSKHTSRWG